MPGWGSSKRENQKQIKSFLGFSVYFHNFVENYAALAAPLHDMSKDDFDWTTSRDYEPAFQKFKEALDNAMDIIYPDFQLEWVLLTDASDIACGWILFQLRLMEDGTVQTEPISVGSEKFGTDCKLRWPINEKEAYGLLRGIQTNQHLLSTKPFLVATDHWNLTKQEKDIKKKLATFMLEFARYPIKGCLPIAGTRNNAPDFLSRMHPPTDDPISPTHPPDDKLEERQGIADALDALATAEVIQDVLISGLKKDSNNTVTTQHQLAHALHNVKAFATTITDSHRARRSRNMDNVNNQRSDSPRQREQTRPPTVNYSEDALDEIFHLVHGANGSHIGVSKTWTTCNDLYPGHGMSWENINNRIKRCGACQKRRLVRPEMMLQPIVKVMNPPDLYKTVSIDGIPISPTSTDGMDHIYIIKKLGTNYIMLYPTKGRSKQRAADAVIAARIKLGHITHMTSDPGSDFTSHLLNEVNNILGIKHRLGLVDRPQGTGIERDVAEVKRFLRSLTAHSDMQHDWSTPRILGVAEFLINNDPHMPSNVSPYEMEFGRHDKHLSQLITTLAESWSTTSSTKSAYLDHFKKELNTVRKIYMEDRNRAISKKTRSNRNTPQNRFQPGDLVFQHIDKQKRSSTFASLKLGPHKVIQHISNTVTVRNLINERVQDLHVTKCSLFDGTLDTAYMLARQDAAEHEFTHISGWRGNPNNRQSLSFQLVYNDGSTQWQSYWHSDVKDTVQLDDYCSKIPCLQHITKSKQHETQYLKQLSNKPITQSVGDKLFFDIRYLSHAIYQLREFALSDKYNVTYLMPATITDIKPRKPQKVTLQFDTSEQVTMTSTDYHLYTYDPDNMPSGDHVELTKHMLQTHPYILKAQLPKGYESMTNEQWLAWVDPY